MSRDDLAVVVVVGVVTLTGMVFVLLARARQVGRRRRRVRRVRAAQDAAVAVATGSPIAAGQQRLLNRHLVVVCTVLATFAGAPADRLRSVVTASTRDGLLRQARWHRNPAARIGALEQLALLGQGVHDGADIVDLLDDPESDVVVATAACLLYWDPARWSSELCRRLTSSSGTALRVAELLIANRRELGQSVSVAILELGATVPLVRVLAATVTPETSGQLAALVTKAPDPQVRSEAVYALAQVRGGAEVALSAIRDAYHDGSPAVRVSALRAAGRLRVRDLTVATAGLLGDESFEVRISACDALADLPGGVSALAVLTSGIDPLVARFAVVGLTGAFARRGLCEQAADNGIRGREICEAFPTLVRVAPVLAASIVDDPGLSPAARVALIIRRDTNESTGRVPAEVVPDR